MASKTKILLIAPQGDGIMVLIMHDGTPYEGVINKKVVKGGFFDGFKLNM